MDNTHRINLGLAVIKTMSEYLNKHSLDGFKESKEIAEILIKVSGSLPLAKEKEV